MTEIAVPFVDIQINYVNYMSLVENVRLFDYTETKTRYTEF